MILKADENYVIDAYDFDDRQIVIMNDREYLVDAPIILNRKLFE